MKVIPVPMLQDNYAFILYSEVNGSKMGAIIDPVEPEKVLKVADDNGVTITQALITHHHWDHAGGNEKLLALRKMPILGADKRINCISTMLQDNQEFNLGNLSITPLLTPGHTEGHVAYFVKDRITSEMAVFTGDLLFVAGCGKFFEGSPSVMHTSLQRIATLPSLTKIYCGHEYTQSNLKFAAHVEPSNQKITEKIQSCEQKSMTIPSSVQEELDTNPFLRAHLPGLQTRMGTEDTVTCLGRLRELKDNFKA